MLLCHDQCPSSPIRALPHVHLADNGRKHVATDQRARIQLRRFAAMRAESYFSISKTTGDVNLQAPLARVMWGSQPPRIEDPENFNKRIAYSR
jgi:hypothetical protein